MGIGAGGKFSFEAVFGFAIVESGYALIPCLNLHQHLGQVLIRRRSAHHRDIRGPLENLFALLLRNAAEHGTLLSLLLILLVVAEAIETLLLRLVPNGARVVQHQPGLFHRLHLPVHLTAQRANDLFRVMDVHLAAKGFEVERLLWDGGHIYISTQYKRWSSGPDSHRLG